MDRYEQFIAHVVDHCCNRDVLTEHEMSLLKRAEYVVANGGRKHPHPGVCDECSDYGQSGECELCELADHIWKIAPKRKMQCPRFVDADGLSGLECGTAIGFADEAEVVLCQTCQDFVQGMA